MIKGDGAFMATYFVFSDEAGCYRKERNNEFVKANPFFIRASLIIDSSDWKTLNLKFHQLKKRYGLPAEKEVKWSYLWSLRKDQKNGRLSEDKPFYFLKNFTEDQLLSFVTECLDLLTECSYCKVIYTITLNYPELTPVIDDQKIYEMHIQDTMQRIEMEIENDKDNLAILFLDPINRKTDDLIRESYRRIYLYGDFIKKYEHLKDNLSFELSHHSFGIQLADYCAGVFNNALKGYHESIDIFRTTLWKLVRKYPDGNFMGYGIVEIPKNEDVRKKLSRKIDNLVHQLEPRTEHEN